VYLIEFISSGYDGQKKVKPFYSRNKNEFLIPIFFEYLDRYKPFSKLNSRSENLRQCSSRIIQSSIFRFHEIIEASASFALWMRCIV
jgi:hypothetical protein